MYHNVKSLMSDIQLLVYAMDSPDLVNYFMTSSPVSFATTCAAVLSAVALLCKRSLRERQIGN